MSIADENLVAARRAHDRAAQGWRIQCDLGGIRLLNAQDDVEAREIQKGRKYTADSPSGAVALGAWQKAKAELDHMAAVSQRERGDESCVVCKDTHARMSRDNASGDELAGLRKETERRLGEKTEDDERDPRIDEPTTTTKWTP